MFKTKTIRPSTDSIDTILQRERMPSTGVYDTIKSTTSNVDDPSEYVLEYI